MSIKKIVIKVVKAEARGPVWKTGTCKDKNITQGE